MMRSERCPICKRRMWLGISAHYDSAHPEHVYHARPAPMAMVMRVSQTNEDDPWARPVGVAF